MRTTMQRDGMTGVHPTPDSVLERGFVLLDVGADGGVFELPGLAAHCDVHAFEPRADSSAELIAESTEKIKASHGGYRNLIVHPYGLASSTGAFPLHVTRIPQASSLREPNQAVVSRWRMDRGLDVVDKVEIDCLSLADFVSRNGLDRIDFIKLDTQGTELDILLGSPDELAKISVISSEVEFIELYKGQSLFDDIIRHLRPHGFRFVGFRELYTLDRTPKAKNVWAEAVFVNESADRPAEAAIAAGLILMELGFLQDGKWVLADSGCDPDAIAAAGNRGRLASLAWNYYVAARAFNQRRRAAGKKPVNLQPIKRILARVPFFQRLFTLSGDINKRFE